MSRLRDGNVARSGHRPPCPVHRGTQGFPLSGQGLPPLLLTTEADQTCVETYSDISGILFSISISRMEADQIRMKMDSDILNIHFSIFILFPSLYVVQNIVGLKLETQQC